MFMYRGRTISRLTASYRSSFLSLRWRPMKSKDVAGCAEIIASHPAMGPRHGSAIKDLGRAWLRLLGSEAMPTAVFEAAEKG